VIEPVLISVRHVTSYAYAEPVGYAIQSLRLTPASFNGHRVIAWQVRATGAGEPLEFKDGHGNLVHLVTISAQHQSLTIEAAGIVETTDSNGVVDGLANASPPRVYLRETAQTRPDPAIRELAQSVANTDSLGRLHALSATIRHGVQHVLGSTDAHTSAAEALAAGKGVCQDHAHIFVAAARSLGIPARYVTGYLLLDSPAAAAAHHAWAEAWVEGLGWVGFDVANRICPTERYVRLAAGLDAKGAAPITGSRRGGDAEKLDVCVLVQQQQNAQQ
jgi:transglutaminase-like putative cysteine protease